MRELLGSKRANLNDMGLIFLVLVILFALNFVLPFIVADSSSGDTEGLTNDVRNEAGEEGYLGFFGLIKIFFGVLIWTFNVPLWLNLLVLEPLRLMAYFIIARNIWIGGGG